MRFLKKIFFFLFISSGLFGQNTVNVTLNLVPPYSTRLSDYANQPGKVLITLRNTISRVQNIYLRINITGDNGVQVFTNPNFRANRAVTLQPNAIVTLTTLDLQTLFDVNSLSTRGTSINQIERQNGLPEGTYSVCVRAYDFTRQNLPLSQESPQGCTTIRLTQLEPPILIKPFADEELSVLTPQNQIFLWTQPAGSPAGTQYQLKIVEMFDPKRNPNDAFLSSTNPPFFEKIVNVNTYVYGPSDPPLVEGRKYAWAVTALDKVNAGGGRFTSEGSSFRNGGRSEVRSFVYGKNRNATGQNITIAGTKKKEAKPKNQLQFDQDFNLKTLMTTVSGKLFFNFPEDLNLTSDGFLDRTKYPDYTEKATSVNMFKIRAIDHVKPNLLSKPLQKVKVTLLKVYVFPLTGTEQSKSIFKDNFDYQLITDQWAIVTGIRNIDKAGGNYIFGKFTIDGESMSGQNLIQPMASGYTDENGNFSIQFMQSDTMTNKTVNILIDNTHNYKALLQKVLILKIENPYYNSPFVLINSLPGENIQLPEMVCTVRSFGLEITAKNNEKVGQMGGAGASLENINFEFLRLKQPNPNLPSEEGQNLPLSAKNSLKIPDSHKYLLSNNTIERVISLGKTDYSGKIQLNRIVKLGNDSERFVAHAYSDKNIGVYSKIDAFKVFDVNNNANFKYDNDLVVIGKDLGIEDLSFNISYQRKNYKADLILPSAPAVIKGKVVENNLPLKDVVAVLKKRTLALGTGIAKAIAYDGTDQDGYFEFKNVEPGDYIIEFVKEGYKLGVYDGSVSSKNETFDVTTFNVKNYFTVLFGQLLQTNEIKMIPNGILAGCVRDEEDNKVIVDIKVGSSTIFKNIEKANVEKVEGCFLFSAPSGPQKITLLPRSLEYFPEELNYTIKETGITTIPNEMLVVYRKKHRMNFVVLGKGNSDTGIPISKAKVTVNGKEYMTDNSGNVLVEFESPGTKFLVKVKPDAKDNYAAWEKEIDIPVVKKPVSYEIFLEKGKEIVATVTENENGVTKPSKGAKVYIKSLGKSWGNNTSNFTECYTDEKGNCTLSGIPQSESNIKVWVMKDEQTVKTANLLELQKSGTQVGQNTGNLQNTVLNPSSPSGNSASSSVSGSYLGEEKTVSLLGNKTTVNLQLKFEKGLNIKDIWGLPVKIEKIQPADNGSIIASGYFYNLPENQAFKVADKNLRLEFANVKLAKTNSGKNTHEPVSSEINIIQNSFAVVIGTQLQGKVSANTSSLNPILQQEFPRIKVRKMGNTAELIGAVELRLSSFEGAYQFSGKFNLAEENQPSKIVIFKSGEIGSRKLQIGLATSADKIEPVKYKVHGFDATSDLTKSYVLGDSVKIFTVLHTKIPEIQPSDISLQAGYITVLPKKILPFAGGNEIAFNLEKWKVTGQKTNFNTPTWIFDKINGGLLIPKVLVNTGLIAISLKNVIVKPDKLVIDPQNFEQQEAKNFTLGGLIPLDIVKGATASFTFDPNAYHDNKPHWKFTLSAPAGVKTAASVSNLDGLEKGQKLEFGTMNLFSDNQQQLNSPSSSLLRFFDILDFKLNTIDVGVNTFTMVGNASLAIPNMKSQNLGSEGVLGQIVYGKNASGQIKATIKPMFFSIEGKGQVRFDASDLINSQTLTQGKFTSKGKIKIYDTQSGKDFFVDGFLTHIKSGNNYTTHITVEPNQKIPLENKYLAIKPGLEYSSMVVKGNEWQNLKLTTILPNSGSGGFNQLLEDEKNRTIVFIVKGAIETDPSSGAVGIKGMDTGMGQLSLYYNFQRQEVRGQFLFTPPAPIPMGLFNLNSSNVSMAIGGSGIYLMTNGVGDVAIAGLPLPLTLGYSFIGGYYTKPIYPEDQNIFLSLAVKKTFPDVFQNEIKGMMISGSVSVEPFNESFSYFDETLQTGAKGKVVVGIAAESRNYFKYNEGTNATLFCGNYSYGGVTIEGSAEILGIGAYAGAHANIQISTEGSINTPDITKGSKSIKESISSLKLEGCGSITMGIFLGVESPLGDAGFNINKTISARAGYKNQEPYIEFSLNDCGNAMPNDKIKHTVEKIQ